MECDYYCVDPRCEGNRVNWMSRQDYELPQTGHMMKIKQCG